MNITLHAGGSQLYLCAHVCSLLLYCTEPTLSERGKAS